MMTGKIGKVDDVLILKNMMLAYLGHLNIQWDWPRCPSPWHALHLSCWVFNVWSRQVWDNQCLTAVLCRIPCVFHFFLFLFNLRIHACNKNKITTFSPLHPVWQHVSAVKICSIQRSQFQRQMWDQAQNHFKETKPLNTLRPRDSFCFLLVSSHFF